MAEFLLPSGKVALVDDVDAHLLSGRNWYTVKKGRVYYVFGRHPGQRRGGVYLHRLIAKIRVDHSNHDGLDNRRENLRPSTQRQNTFNQRKRVHKRSLTSQFKGVSFAKHLPIRPWRTYISVGGRRIGHHFSTEKAAARFYDELAVAYHGEFAVLNFSEEWQGG
jgi:hypothetical protein